jgi:hypothetical protein
MDYICGKASKRVYFLTLLKWAGYSPEDILHVFTSVIRSVVEYSCEVWHPGLTQGQARCIEHIQKRAVQIAYPDLDYLDALRAAGLDALGFRREKCCKTLYENISKPSHKLHHLLPKCRKVATNLRKLKPCEPFKCRTERFKNSPINHLLFKYQWIWCNNMTLVYSHSNI